MSSSILVSRQIEGPPFYDGIGPALPIPSSVTSDNSPGSTTSMDCDSKSKDDKPDYNNIGATGVQLTTADQNSNSTTTNVNKNSNSTTTTAGLPIVARRRFHRPMRRGEVLNIFERRDGPSKTTTSSKPITVSDVLVHYLKQRAASRKRATRPRTSRRAN